MSRARARAPRFRLTVGVAVVLAVTTAGTLVGPAGAATAAPAGAAAVARQSGAVFPFPTGAVATAGPSGFLAFRTDDVVWTRYADGSGTTFPKSAAVTYRGAAGADVVVASEGTRHTVHDMAGGGDPVVIDVPYELREVNGSTLVMVDTATKELHLVSRAPGGEVVDRKVTGMPAGVPWKFYGSTPGTVAVLTSTPDSGFPLALVDVATAANVETYDLGSYSDFAQVTPDRVLWEPVYGQTRIVDRKTKQAETLPYRAKIALGGDWLAITGGDKVVVDGVTYPNKPIVLKSLKDGRKVPLLDLASRVVEVGDGTLLVFGGTFAQGEGLFRVSLDASGTPVATMIGDGQRPLEMVLERVNVPSVYHFYGTDENVTWETNQGDLGVSLELTHVATGRKVSLWSYYDTFIRWDGYLDQVTGAYNGAYTWKMTANPPSGVGPAAVKTGTTTVDRGTAPRDFNDNARPDALVRDSSGNLSAYDISQLGAMGNSPDCHEEGCPPVVRDPKPDVLGTGWNTYTLMASPGNLAGSASDDVVGRDRDGVLWLHQSDRQKLLPRTKIGGGWNIYDKITGGSDLNGDDRGDLLATDKAGVLWFYASTGNATAPFKTRTKIGSGWGAYNLLTAPGNIAGASGGDLLARDTSGTLWLYLGRGDGTFTARREVGGGWQKYTHIFPAGTNGRGVADIYAIGPSGSALYSGRDSTTRPFETAHPLPLRSDSTRFRTFL
ncbi:hypothetical protein Q5762_30565 [Streptomyces sp. P9(2023)]|uniref:hypothetical protein n=1 Tax=Streptomyces sp. P9(2023) TaxID=3064394 RepID=UPI0028F40CBD|nr:hypothetical protein [Streptomyces sp. P9(2023)]MDT9692597.1 hypothetical protein [Streptomyces sp. P9(2023)]